MTANRETELHQRRVMAAQLSGGISSNAIYSMIERAIISAGLNGKVLDYGAGVGNLTKRLLSLGRFTSVASADIMPAPADLAHTVEWIEQDLSISLPGHEGAFDIVVAAEVIEHLENPRFMIREVFRLLCPGGVALISTPNNESWRSILAMIIRGHHASFGDLSYPAHITALLRKDFMRIFAEAGFESPQFHFTNEGGVPGRPSITWQSISLGSLKGIRFSDNLLAVATKPSTDTKIKNRCAVGDDSWHTQMGHGREQE
jgi:2-polyprenyl-3-methyl-5-hydroxy-6-metoxy-1,4-benzoquinol methylase